MSYVEPIAAEDANASPAAKRTARKMAPRLNIVVTGASAGVGRATALRLAGAGARLGLIARDEEALQVLAAEVRELGTDCIFAALDVADARAVEAAAERFNAELGPIDVWVNDAMVTVFSPVHEITPEEFREVTEVTYLGVVHGCMAASKLMRLRGRGHIINIGSALAYRGIPLQSAYCGAKHAIRGFTASLRTELKHDRLDIPVTLIELPAVNTPQFDWARTHMGTQPRPMGTVYQPEAIAEAVWRAVERAPREYWVGWSTVETIIGNMVSPGFLDGILARKAYRGQSTELAVRPDRQDNLFKPVTNLHRTRGVFDKEAKPRALIVSGSATRYAVVAAGAFLFFALGGIIL
jgi:NAD(P)-dependent dehydrogenase (short-subunit alcohol dehydrogenase family)